MPRNFSRLVMVLGAALLAGAPALHAQSGAQPVRGDVDGDGRVTAADARIVSDYLVGKPVPAGARVLERGDVNGDGRVTSVDAAIIARAAAGRDVSRFPVGRPAGEDPNALATLTCRADLRAGSVNCGDRLPSGEPAGPRGQIIGGPNHLYVSLTTDSIVVTTNPGDSTFSFDVKVKNLIPQALGTTDGVNPHAEGVRVFFLKNPTPNGPGNNGNITVASDGEYSFTSGLQPYYQFPGIIAPGDSTGERRFHFDVHGGVTTFDFTVKVSAAVQYPSGWIDVYPPDHAPSPYVVFDTTVYVGETLPFTAIVRTPLGTVHPDSSQGVNWSSNNDGVATVNETTGQVTTVSSGDALITATRGGRSGSTLLHVTTHASVDSTTITAAPTSFTAGDSSLITVQVKNALGDPDPAPATVTLTTTLGKLYVTTDSGTTVTPNSNGNGVYTAWLKSPASGTATITGTLNSVAIVDNATVTVGVGAPANMVKSAGDGQTANAGSAVAVAPAVTITDAHGNPVSGVSVTFAVASGGTGSGVTGTPAVTNASGVATVGSWTLGNTAGANTLDASSAGLTTVTFTATGVAGPPALIEKVEPLTTDTVNPGGVVDPDPRVRVKDAHGNLVSNTSVTFMASAGSTVAPASVMTDGSGEAAVTSWTVDTEGAKTLTVGAGSAPTVVFDAYGNMAPVGVRDSIDAIGNVQVTATGLKGNDTDPENETTTITPGTFPTAGGGSVTITALGGVTYNSAIGYVGLDSVSYTVNDPRGRSATGKLMIRVPDRFWFVQGGGSGNGSQSSPSGNFTFGAALAAKDSIFLLSTATVPSGVTLPNGGALIGTGIGSNITRTLGGGANMTVDPVTLVTAGSPPTLTVSSGTGVALAAGGSGYIVKGLALVTSNGAGISGSNFGTLSLSTNELSINATGGAALSLTTGTLSGILTGVTASGGTNNVVLSGVTLSGATSFGGGALSGASGTALSLTNVTSPTSTDSLFYSGSIGNSSAGASVGVNGGNTRLRLTGNVSQSGVGAAVSVSGGHTGTLSFSTTISGSAGTGLQFDNADGTYAFDNGVTFSTGGDAGIDVLNGSGGTFTFPASSSITNPTGEAIRINASSPSFTYLGRIDKTNGSTGIAVTSNTGGTISFGSRRKLITSTGSNVAVNLTSNGTATITSVDSLVITSATGNGYNATGGGTVVVQGANNTINSSGGIALNVSSTTIGASGLTFRSISASGGTNGIFLSSTGTSGGLTVTGDGSTNSSGGTITNATGGDGATAGNGIYLNDTRNVSLSWMGLSGHQNNGLYGSGVRGLTMNKMRFTGNNGTSNSGTFDESAVNLVNLGGAVKVTNSRFDGGAYNAFRVENTAGTAPVLDSLVLDTDTVTTMQGSTADIRGTAVLVTISDGTVDTRIRNSRVLAWWGNAIHVLVQGTASGITRITNNFADNTNGALAGAGGIAVVGGTHQYNISGNTVRHTDGTAISADRVNFGTTMQGTISGNTIGVSGDNGSGSRNGNGIFASHHGPGTTTHRISSNTIRQVQAFSGSGAIWVLTGDAAASGGSGAINATVVGNNIQEHATLTAPINAHNGILVTVGTSSSAPGDTDQACLDIGGAGALQNTILNFNSNTNRIRVSARFGTTSRFPGYTGAASGGTSQTDLASYLVGRNAAGVTSVNQNTSTGGFNNTSPAGSACPQPSI